MTFEKQSSGSSAEPTEWTACANCSYNDKDSSSLKSGYHSRSSDTASAKNAELNGKSCVSS